MLRKDFNNQIEFTDDYNSENTAKKQVMDFYLSMMRREIYYNKDAADESHYDHDSDMNNLALDDGKHCYPLCEQRFKNEEAIRYISPCGHGFHEKCIKIWLYRGENQFCPHCRGNIMKENKNTLM